MSPYRKQSDAPSDIIVTMSNERETQKNHSPTDATTITSLGAGLNPDKLSEFIDRHIHIFRHLPYAVGILGCVVLFRSIRLSSKFTKIQQIPQSFIRKNVKLRGKIEEVHLDDGTLDVQHSPIWRMPWHRFYKSSPLNIHLAFTSPTLSGTYWMRLNAKGKPIKFQLIDRNVERNKLWALVQLKLPDSKMSLNETLVRRGLAKVDLPKGNINLTKTQSKLLSSLELNQLKAMKEGTGVWSLTHKPTQTTWLDASKEKIGAIYSKLKPKMKQQQ